MRELRFEHALLDADKVTEGVDPLTKEPVVRIPATFTMEGVMNGSLKPASEVENPMFWRYFDGLPYVPDHPAGEQVVVTAASEMAGFIDRPKLKLRGNRPQVDGRVNIYKERDTGKRALHRIFDLGMDEVSIGFWTTPERMDGVYHDAALDADVEYHEMDTDMKPDHVATVDMGACSGDMGCGLKREAKLKDPVKDSGVPMGEDGQPLGDSTGPAAAAYRTAGPGAVSDLLNGGSDSARQGAVAPHAPPKAPEEVAWSFSGADGNAIIERGGFAAYKQAHAWFEGTGTPEEKNKYKLPHHKVVGDGIKGVWRGVAAAAVVIQGGRGGLNIPAGDVTGVKRHVSGHYKQFDREPPFDEKGNWARNWLYAEEFDALMEARKAGILDADWFDRFVDERPACGAATKAKATLVDRMKAWLTGHNDKDGGDPVTTTGDEDMCDKCEALEQERDDVATELVEMKAELTTLTTEREDQEREDLLSRLGAATGLKDDALTEALQDTGILPTEEDATADLEALRTAVRSVELTAPRTKAVGSVGEAEQASIGNGFTVGRLGIDYELDKHGNVVDLTDAAEDGKDDVLKAIRAMVAKEVA